MYVYYVHAVPVEVTYVMNHVYALPMETIDVCVLCVEVRRVPEKVPDGWQLNLGHRQKQQGS